MLAVRLCVLQDEMDTEHPKGCKLNGGQLPLSAAISLL